MKRILLLILMFAWFGAQSQVVPTAIYKIPNASTAFGTNIAIGNFVFDTATGKLYYCATATLKTATLTTGSANFTDFLSGVRTRIDSIVTALKDTALIDDILAGYIAVGDTAGMLAPYPRAHDPVFSGTPKLGTDTLATKNYARSVGGGNITEEIVKSLIEDSLNARFGAKVALNTIAPMLQDSNKTKPGGYVTLTYFNNNSGGMAGLQDSLNNRYRRRDTANVILSRERAAKDYAAKIHAHGQTDITGLADSLLDRYNKDQADAIFAALTHSHVLSDITNLLDSLANKYTKGQSDALFAPITHAHAQTDITALDDSLLDRYNKDQADAIFAALTHSHVISAITNLQDSLDNRFRRQDTANVILSRERAAKDYAAKIHNHGQTDVTGLADSLLDRYNKDQADAIFAALTHSHVLSDITNLLDSLANKYTKGQTDAIFAPKADPVFTGTPKIGTDSVATKAYARSVGGSSMTEETVKGLIEDSLNARFGAKVALNTLVPMMADSNKMKPGGYITLTYFNNNSGGMAGLQDSLNNRFRRGDTANVILSRERAAKDYAALIHSHVLSDITNLLDSLGNKLTLAQGAARFPTKTLMTDSLNARFSAKVALNTLALMLTDTTNVFGRMLHRYSPTVYGVLKVDHLAETTASHGIVLDSPLTLNGLTTMPVASQIKLTIPTSDNTATGEVEDSFVSGYTSTAIGDLVYLDSNFKWQKADNTTSAATKGGRLGFALEVKATDNAVKVLTKGYLYCTALPALSSGPIYMSTAGTVTMTQPSASGAGIRIVGFGVHADKLYFDPENAYWDHQ